MLPKVRMTGAALCGALLLVLPTTAADAAKKKKKPKPAKKTAVFTAELHGKQVSSWSYKRPLDPTSPCDSSQDGEGSQVVQFWSANKWRVTVMGKEVIGLLPGDFTSDRLGRYAAGYDASGDCGAVAEGDSDGTVDPQDCGGREGDATLGLSYGRRAVDGYRPDGEELVLVADLSGLEFANCPYWVGGPQAGSDGADILTSGTPIKFDQLFNKRKKVIKVSGKRTKPYMADWFTGRAEVSWELTLRRVR